MPRPAVEGKDFDAAAVAVLIGAEQNFAAAAVLDQIGGKLGGDERDPAGVALAEAILLGDHGGLAPRLGDLARIVDGNCDHQAFQRVIVIFVPTPTFDSIENSFDRRRAPPRPRPRPEPEVKPSFRAC